MTRRPEISSASRPRRSANFDRWSVSVLYGDYAAQPDLGYLTRREGILVNGSVKIASNWVATGAARWDLVANQINQYVVGAGYVDDCFVLAANYVTSFSYATTTSPPILGHAFMLQLGLADPCQYDVIAARIAEYRGVSK